MALPEAILKELNAVRAKPALLAERLEQQRSLYSADKILRRPGKIDLKTNEGVAAVDEAIAFLKRQKPLPAFALSAGMTAAAQDHVMDAGPKALMGHDGSDGSSPFDRLSKHGRWSGSAGENISKGCTTAAEVVAQLVVDDGTPSRGHRTNIYSDAYKLVGIADGPHASPLGTMAVIVFASSYVDGAAPASSATAAVAAPSGGGGGGGGGGAKKTSVSTKVVVEGNKTTTTTTTTDAAGNTSTRVATRVETVG